MGRVRGYSAIGLIAPKCNENVSGAFRAAHCYGAAMVAIQGPRYQQRKADTTKAWRHIPLIITPDIFSVIPMACVPIAVELVEGAVNLVEFVHPERAFYIFGPEDGSLEAGVIEQCKHVVAVPTQFCMNLASTANVVLYDRLAKSGKPNGKYAWEEL